MKLLQNYLGKNLEVHKVYILRKDSLYKFNTGVYILKYKKNVIATNMWNFFSIYLHKIYEFCING